jgi:hypothetical protein
MKQIAMIISFLCSHEVPLYEPSLQTEKRYFIDHGSTKEISVRRFAIQIELNKETKKKCRCARSHAVVKDHTRVESSTA